jgi:hypothetical protein
MELLFCFKVWEILTEMGKFNLVQTVMYIQVELGKAKNGPEPDGYLIL